MFEVIELKKISDDKGTLAIGELGKELPFLVRRFYFLYDLSSKEARGFHAHHKCRQVAICLKGSLDMHFDNGAEKIIYKMNGVSQAVTIEPFVWHEMHAFSDDCILLVLASDEYDENDYIRDYEDFMVIVTA